MAQSITNWFSKSDADLDVTEKNCQEPTTGSSSSDIDVSSAEAGKSSSEMPNEEKVDPERVDQDVSATTFDVQKAVMEETSKMMKSAWSFGSYLFGAATETSKKMSDSVYLTALKSTVEEKTLIGDLNKEQEEFIQKKRENEGAATGGGALPPWSGYEEEDVMKQKILALSSDSRNFLRSPPAGVQFHFELGEFLPIAMAVLKEDDELNKMRFRLVPTKVKEETFWRNYFYRVSLIKQSAQLSSLAMSRSSSASSIVIVGSTATGTTSSGASSPSASKLCKEEAITADQVESAVGDEHDEFASDAVDSAALNPDDLEREMRELGMTNDGGEGAGGSEWEQELQRELQEFEVVHDGEEKDEALEQEIEDMLESADEEQS